MADPAPVVQTFFVDDDIKDHFALDAVLTLVDAKHILQHLEEERPEGVENESGAQQQAVVACLSFKVGPVCVAKESYVHLMHWTVLCCNVWFVFECHLTLIARQML